MFLVVILPQSKLDLQVKTEEAVCHVEEFEGPLSESEVGLIKKIFPVNLSSDCKFDSKWLYVNKSILTEFKSSVIM